MKKFPARIVLAKAARDVGDGFFSHGLNTDYDLINCFSSRIGNSRNTTANWEIRPGK